MDFSYFYVELECVRLNLDSKTQLLLIFSILDT